MRIDFKAHANKKKSFKAMILLCLLDIYLGICIDLDAAGNTLGLKSFAGLTAA